MPVVDLSMGGGVSSHAARRRSARLQRRENARQSLQGQEDATPATTGEVAETMSGDDVALCITFYENNPPEPQRIAISVRLV